MKLLFTNRDPTPYLQQYPIIDKDYNKTRNFNIWKKVIILGYTPPEWVWNIHTTDRNKLFKQAMGLELDKGALFLDSMKHSYV
jgi:hypothetical protein